MLSNIKIELSIYNTVLKEKEEIWSYFLSTNIEDLPSLVSFIKSLEIDFPSPRFLIGSDILNLTINYNFLKSRSIHVKNFHVKDLQYQETP